MAEIDAELVAGELARGRLDESLGEGRGAARGAGVGAGGRA